MDYPAWHIGEENRRQVANFNETAKMALAMEADML